MDISKRRRKIKPIEKPGKSTWSDKPCLRCEYYFKRTSSNKINKSCDVCNEYINRNRLGE